VGNTLMIRVARALFVWLGMSWARVIFSPIDFHGAHLDVNLLVRAYFGASQRI